MQASLALRNQLPHSFLKRAYDGAIRSAIARAYVLSPRPQEPDFVYQIVAHVVPGLGSALSTRLAGTPLQASVVGVFCHQSPYVWFNVLSGGPQRRELGDLLFVVRYAKGAEQSRTSLLLQFKVGNVSLNPRDAQVALYDYWPTLTWDSPPYRGEQRIVVPPTVHPGAKFAFIDRTAHTVTAVPTSGRGRGGLPNELAHLTLWRAGRPFSDRGAAQCTSGWDRIVWDLLDGTALRLFNRTQSGVRDESRGFGTPYLHYLTHGDSIPSVLSMARQGLDMPDDGWPQDNVIIDEDDEVRDGHFGVVVVTIGSD